MVLDDNTMQRTCHGEMYFSKATGEKLVWSNELKEEFRQAVIAQREPSFEIRLCTHTWHQSEDEANGLGSPEEQSEYGRVVSGRVVS